MTNLLKLVELSESLFEENKWRADTYYINLFKKILPFILKNFSPIQSQESKIIMILKG